MRKKPNLLPRMEACAAVQVKEPEALCGRWLAGTPYRELRVEFGCGKGRFTADTAAAEPDVLFVAVERVPDAMVVAMERVCARGLANVRFIDIDAVHAPEIFAPGEVARIYINFPDPWPKKKQFKRRLTAPSFLKLYETILAPGGEIWFKTDNRPLFEWSLETFAANGWQTAEVTFDLHADGPVGVMTDYEAKFYGEGVPIDRCVAKKAVQGDET